jgi:hypothetical protein
MSWVVPNPPKQRSPLVEFQLGPLAHPLNRVAEDDSVLNVVVLAAKGCRPLLVNVLTVIRVDGAKKRLVRQGRALGDSENAMVFIGPEQFIALNVQSPTPGMGHCLSTIQIFPVLP